MFQIPLLVCAAFLPAAQEPASAAATDQAPLTRRLPAARTLQERLARDARLGFGARAGRRAREKLDAGLRGEEERAVALMALGCRGSRADLRRLESAVADADAGTGLVRRAALLALGEMGAEGLGALERLARGGSLARSSGNELMLAWIRTATDTGRARVQGLAGDPTAPGHAAARRLQAYAAGGAAPVDDAAFELLLELRWKAARRYGFIDGERWRSLVFRDLLADEEFLDRVVLGASLGPDSPSVRDHLLEIALRGGTPGRLRAVVAGMPGELARLIETGAWTPASTEEWKALLDGIASRRLEREAQHLLKVALEVEAVRWQAAILYIRGGGQPPLRWLLGELRSAPPARQATLLEAFGESGDAQRIIDVAAFLDERYEERVRAFALVALVRLQHPPAADALQLVFQSGPGAQRAHALEAVVRAAHDKRLSRWIIDALARKDLEPPLRFRLEVAFGLQGRLRTRDALRGWLELGVESPLRVYVVRGLIGHADRRDLKLLRDIFPVDDDLDMNVELGLGLVHYRGPEGRAILRAALWGSDWNRSVLAGRLMVRAGGIHALLDELAAPSAAATEEDMRRVGWAVGQWGGLAAVESLGRRRGENDPAVQGALLGWLSTRTH